MCMLYSAYSYRVSVHTFVWNSLKNTYTHSNFDSLDIVFILIIWVSFGHLSKSHDAHTQKYSYTNFENKCLCVFFLWCSIDCKCSLFIIILIKVIQLEIFNSERPQINPSSRSTYDQSKFAWMGQMTHSVFGPGWTLT